MTVSGTLRIVSLAGAILLTVASGVAAVTSFPVIADSDLGRSAMERVRDWGVVAAFAAAATIIASGLIPRPRLRIALATVLLCIVAGWSFESFNTPHWVRWPLLAVVGLMIASEPFGSSRGQAGRRSSPYRAAAMGAVLPALLILTDWQGRIYRGLMPLAHFARPADPTGAAPAGEAMRTSVGLIDFPRSAVSISSRTRLKAVGGNDGVLAVEPMDGGPALRIPPSGRDRVPIVVSFSPDGTALAVADNDSMYVGSVITVWDVALPARPDEPPRVTLRHILAGHPHLTFSLDFFPDGRTLVSANGDNTVSLWDLPSGGELAQFVAHHDPGRPWAFNAECVAASPDGRTFATWSVWSLKLWDRQTLKQLRMMDAQGAIGCALGFTPDGRRLVATDRTSVWVWEVHPSLTLPALLLAAAAGLIGFAFWTAR